MLRKIRISLAVACLTLITLLFLDFTGTCARWFGWLAKIQFLPALMALNAGIIVGLVLFTLVFGRIYCSVICPLGVMQDCFAALGKRAKKNRYRYSPALNTLRYTMLALMVLAIVFGISAFMALLAPYSAYGRIAQTLLSPIWLLGNNLLARWAETEGSYTFYNVDIWLRGWDYPRGGVGHTDNPRHSGMAQRPYILQHCLPGRHSSRLPVALLAAEANHRHIKM